MGTETKRGINTIFSLLKFLCSPYSSSKKAKKKKKNLILPLCGHCGNYGGWREEAQ
jgi:hypothetical protein